MYRVPFKTRFGNVENVIQKTCYATYMQQGEFRGVKQTRIYAILLKIVKLTFPHKLRVCSAICVEYRVVYRVVVIHIVCNVKTRYCYLVFECTAVNKTRCKGTLHADMTVFDEI